MGIVTALVALIGVGLGVAGARRVGRALHRAQAHELIYGIRAVIVGIVTMIGAASLASGQNGLLVLAAVLLGEELYETALVAAIIRSGEEERYRIQGDKTLRDVTS
jgi:hypothetical protein